MQRLLAPIKQWARTIKRDILALWIAARDPRTPWHAKAAAGAVAAYALSPIDLIPDFIPILGYLDEVILLPVAIALIVKLIPPQLMEEFRSLAATRSKPVSKAGMAAVVMIWTLIACALLLWMWPSVEAWFIPTRTVEVGQQ